MGIFVLLMFVLGGLTNGGHHRYRYIHRLDRVVCGLDACSIPVNAEEHWKVRHLNRVTNFSLPGKAANAAFSAPFVFLGR
jgi:hypothetical protein